MNYKLSLVLLFTFSIIISQNSKIDSLKDELSIENIDTKKLKILTTLNKFLFDDGNPEESLPFYKQMNVLSLKVNNHKYEIESYKYITEFYMVKMDSINALKTAQLALDKSQNYNNPEYVLNCYNLLARVHHYFDNYENAIILYKKGIDFYDKNPVGKTICILYSNLGNALGIIGKSEEQIKVLVKGAEYAETLNDFQSKFLFLINLGWAYMAQEQYEKANEYILEGLNDSLNIETIRDKMKFHHLAGLNYSRWDKYEKALTHNNYVYEYYKKIGDKRFEFDVLNNTAVVYRKMNQPKKVIEISKKTLKIAQELNHKLAIFVANHTAATAYLDLNQFNEAEKMFLEIAKDSIDTNLIDTQALGGVFDNLSKVYEGKKEYKKSLFYLQKFKSINDSILIKQRDSKVTEIETKYQTEQKEKENLQLKAEKAEQTLQIEKEKTHKWLLGVGLGTSIITLFIFGYYYQKNKKQKLLIESLQKELHHRVKNNLSIIDTFIEVAKEEFTDKAFENKLTELQHRILSINQVHEHLHENKDLTTINVKKYVSELVTNIENSFANEHIKVVLNIAENLTISTDKSFPLGLIINEFLTNSYKYAFENLQEGIIEITINETKNNYLLNLKDNGKGLPPTFNLNKTTTFGIRIMKLLSKQLNGTFELKSENGVQLTIKF